MATLQIHLTRDVHAWYEVTTDTGDTDVVEQLELEKLRFPEYENSLKLDWEFDNWAPEIIEVDDLSSDEEA